MRTKIAGATFILLSAGAGSVGALDNIALQGSDTLEEVTKDVLAACPAATAAGITYKGGGSTTGENAMSAGTQTVASMSRFLNPTNGVCAKGSTAEGILIGLDGLAIVSSSANAAACGGGLAFTKTIDVLNDDGTPATNCLGCTPGTNQYKFADFKDVIALIYAGKHHTGTTSADYECNSPVRKTVANDWAKLFEASCTGSTCTSLKRAFRRSDLSGTTDTFLSLNGISSMPLASTVAGAVAGPIRFCNAYGTGNVFGGASDYLDKDPVRRPCDLREQVCGIDGTLGLVTVIEVPANLTAAENYNTTACTNTRFRLAKPANSGISSCPNGRGLLFGKCFQPYIDLGGGAYDHNCQYVRGLGSSPNPVQGFQGSLPSDPSKKIDGRVYNIFVKDKEGLYKRDNLNRFDTGAFFRIHQTLTIAPGAATCQTASSTEQLGCVAAANPCAISFAGKEATQAVGTVGLSIKGIAPTVANIENLVTTPSTADDYLLARKLYFNTLNGFEAITGGELELAKCMANNAIVGPAITGRNFVAIPGGVQCVDFNETGCVAPATTWATNTNTCTLP